MTSRFVGYEPATFSSRAHYTLQDFADEQIEQFLSNWCPAVEYYQTMVGQHMHHPTAQQKKLIEIEGKRQKEQLLRALKDNPSIKRLAVNPLMLTILALIQKNGKTQPYRLLNPPDYRVWRLDDILFDTLEALV
jgi:predicted NACHT family NTPase